MFEKLVGKRGNVLLALLLFGCSGDPETIPLKGNIAGLVTLTNSYGSPLSDKSGVKVSIDKSTFQMTDVNGKYLLEDIDVGTYNIQFEKEGYGTNKLFAFQFPGGPANALVNEVALYQLPKYEIAELQYGWDGSDPSVTGKIGQSNRYNLYFFLSNDPSISNENYVYSENHSSCCAYNADEINFYASFYASNLTAFGLDLNKNLYLRIYAYNPKDDSYYYNWEEKVQVKPSSKALTNAINLGKRP